MVRTPTAAGADPDAPWTIGGAGRRSPRKIAAAHRSTGVAAAFG
jgi:hypothetical protein